MRTALLIISLFAFAMPAFGQRGSNLFDESYVHEIKIQIDDPDFWNALLTNYNLFNENGEHLYTPADVTIDGTTIHTVGFRIKGFISALAQQGKKKPFRIDFDEFVPDQQYDGMKKLSLNNAFDDASHMRDVLAYNIMRTAGIRASRTAYAKLFINDTYWGLYIMAEQVDKTFLSNYFDHDGGNLFKNMMNFDLSYKGDNPQTYTNWFELKTNETKNDWSGFIKFIKYLNKVDVTDEVYRTEFPKMFDTDSYLKILAVDILLLNWDSYYDNGRNYYIYEDVKEKKFYWIPWDYNFSFSSLSIDILAQNPLLAQTPKPLIRNLLHEPAMYKKLIAAYQTILEDNFTPARLFPIIDQNKALIYEALKSDKNRSIDMAVFEKSLEEATLITVRDTIRDSFDMAKTYLYADFNQIPDSVLQLGINLVDTTQYDKIRFDTVQVNSAQVVYARCEKYYEYQYPIQGLKSFIEKRVEEVTQQIDIITSVPDAVPLSTVVLSPNPADDFVSVSGEVTERPFCLKIYDVTGRQIVRMENEKHLAVDQLPPGVYVVEVSNNDQTVKKRLVKSVE